MSDFANDVRVGGDVIENGVRARQRYALKKTGLGATLLNPTVYYAHGLAPGSQGRVQVTTYSLSGLASDDRYYYTALVSSPYTITRIDRITGATLTYAPGGAANVTSLLCDGTYLWGIQGTNVLKIDPSTMTLVATVGSVGSSPFWLTFDGTYIWVTNNTTGTNLYLINASTNAVAASAALTGSLYKAVFVPKSGGFIYIGSDQTTLYRRSYNGSTFSSSDITGLAAAVRYLDTDGTTVWLCTGGITDCVYKTSYNNNAGASVVLLCPAGTMLGSGYGTDEVKFDGRYLWVRAKGGWVTRVHPYAGTVYNSGGGATAGVGGGLHFDGQAILMFAGASYTEEFV